MTPPALPLFQRLTREGLTPETSRPAPDRLVAGDPVHTVWGLESREGLHCGLWHSTPGAWRVIYTEWEYFHILEGHSTLTDAAGGVTHLRAGASHVLRPGFQGIWEVVTPTLKEYVIRE